MRSGLEAEGIYLAKLITFDDDKEGYCILVEFSHGVRLHRDSCRDRTCG